MNVIKKTTQNGGHKLNCCKMNTGLQARLKVSNQMVANSTKFFKMHLKN